MTATATVPDRTIAQREAALRRANRVRAQRKLLKRALKAGHYTPATVLCALDYDWLPTMRVEEVLLATPKLGPVKVARALNTCRISPSGTIGGISDRQREKLLTYLSERWPEAEIGVAA